MKTRRKWSFVDALVLAVAACAVGPLTLSVVGEGIGSSLGVRDGAAQARVDQAEGRLRFQFSGRPPGWRGYVGELFEERYGVGVEYVGNCCPSAYQRAFERANNQFVIDVVRAEYPDFDERIAFDEIVDEAMDLYALHGFRPEER